MKVILFPSAYAPAVGGVEELTRRLADRLVAAGDSVEVWTNRHPGTLAAREDIAGVAVRRFTMPLPRLRASDLAGFPRTFGATIRCMHRVARAACPDVLHVQCFSTNGVYAMTLAALLRVPLIVTLQGETVMDDHDIYEHSLALRSGLRLGLRRASAVTACSRFVLDDAERFGLRRGAGAVVPNGVDAARAEPPVPLELPFDSFVLGLGRVVGKKGFDLLLEAFARVSTDHPSVGLVIGGDGAARQTLVNHAHDLSLDERVVLPGTLSRGQVAWAMANASVFVLPSRVEPFGIVVLEALQAGQAVVVSARGGAPEVVRDEREGLVVDPVDIGAMAAAIARLLHDEALRLRLGSAGRARADEFDWGAIAERYREIYRSVA